MKHLRTGAAVALLALLIWVGAKQLGPAPALGSFLDPAHGVWALARNAELPNGASDILPTLGMSVEVRYDRRGVPHIFATSDSDAYRALGYVVARDRLFQLWLQTMAASGRLTEIAGARALPLDREMRRLAIPWSAERKMALIDSTPETLSLARAYADGINAYIDHMPKDALPLEFRLLGIKKVPKWDPINSLLLFNRMGWTLAYIAPELTRAVAASRVGAAAAASLFPENSPIQEPIQPNGRRSPRFDFVHLAPPGASDGEVAQTLTAALHDFLPASASALGDGDAEPRAFASNNWAVAPLRSATGAALLAGDPHLELTLPSIWYEVQLVVPTAKLDVYGVTIPGLPAVIIGFNRDIAWTFTNTGADVLDFYIEKVDDDAHPTKYLLDKSWRPLEQRIERYRGPRGEILAVDTLYFTHRGPMRRENGQWLSMRWTVLEQSNETEGFHLAATATTVEEFQRAMGQYFRSPAQNMLVADRHGTIAIRSTGRFPIRPGSSSGFIIRDGTTSESDWRGYLPVDFAPQAKDPPQGYLASANQQPIDPKVASYWLGGEYDPWRAMRINQLLRADSSMTVDKMRRFQTDPGSAIADLFVPYFLKAAEFLGSNPRTDIDATKLAQAAKLLGEWDRRYTKESTRAVLFDLAFTELVNRTWDELEAPSGGALHGKRVVTPSTAVLAELLADSTSEWWDDRTTPRHETRDDILAASLVAALDTARQRYGDPARKGWTWSRVRHANIWHPLHLGSLSALNLPIQGGRSTLNPSVGAGNFGASWRMVVETAPNELKAWGTYPGGQSGNPASSRYKDHLADWMSGDLEPLLTPRWIPQLNAKETVSRLTLRPHE